MFSILSRMAWQLRREGYGPRVEHIFNPSGGSYVWNDKKWKARFQTTAAALLLLRAQAYTEDEQLVLALLSATCNASNPDSATSESASATSNSFSSSQQPTRRQVTDSEGQVGPGAFHWMEQIYGASLQFGFSSPCVQNYGSVATPEGRLLAFPNVFYHKVSGFRLKDPTKPGHSNPVAKLSDGSSIFPPELAQLLLERGLLFGHDDEQRQQELNEAIAAGKLRAAKLPAEVFNMVRREVKR
ncbi:hypothetical protein B0H66DRAFT_636573 [Apodospora peruviana]|uniref:DUF4246 domain-containing protein n=1 Tax=Apodospora peruviana TaxID=516989 RepID=A0AAE0IHM0_9PEZI|nr:hypothetical protein B0H66DRAFT_636573 [Apodospora peruviana]